MLVMNKYCESKWNKSRPAYTIRSKKYRRLEILAKTQDREVKK